jgi:hypothetical protein
VNVERCTLGTYGAVLGRKKASDPRNGRGGGGGDWSRSPLSGTLKAVRRRSSSPAAPINCPFNSSPDECERQHTQRRRHNFCCMLWRGPSSPVPRTKLLAVRCTHGCLRWPALGGFARALDGWMIQERSVKNSELTASLILSESTYHEVVVPIQLLIHTGCVPWYDRH